jgi:hypothetical protein
MSDLATLTAELTLYRSAREAILSGSQSYTINGRALTRANLSDIIKEIGRLETRIAQLNRSGKLVKAPVFGG